MRHFPNKAFVAGNCTNSGVFPDSGVTASLVSGKVSTLRSWLLTS
jgi:hypothetical protein